MATRTVSKTKPMARKKPITGDNTMKYAILLTPAVWTTPHPPLTTPAPMRPPTKAWDELVGSPNHQVMTSQEIAPVRTARSSQAVTIFGSMVPLPIVEATLTPKTKAARKLKKAAQSTATRGVRTLVETTVATELAASWNPFMKSNPRATTTTRTTISNGTVVDIRATLLLGVF